MPKPPRIAVRFRPDEVVREPQARAQVPVLRRDAAARQAREERLRRGVVGSGNHAVRGVGKALPEDDDAVGRAARSRHERSVAGQHLRRLRGIEARRIERREVVQRAVQRRDDVVAQPQIERQVLRHPPVVLRVELVLPEPGAPLLVLGAFRVVLKVPEQCVGDDVARRVARRGRERHHPVLARTRVLIFLAVGHLPAELERVRAGHLAQVVADLIGQVAVANVVPGVVPVKPVSVTSGPVPKRLVP